MEIKAKPKFGRWKKIVLVTSLTLIIAVILVIAFISPIAKYLVEKYDEKYLGRRIEIGLLYLNPFTGYVYFRNLKIYEHKSDSVMLAANGLSADFETMKAFRKTYEISNITLTKPVGYIIQNRREINFDDLIKLFTPKQKKEPSSPKDRVHFNILNIEIKDGEFHYIEKSIPINYYVKHVNIESTGKRWDTDSMKMKFAFESGPSKGDIKGNCSINFDNLNYRLQAVVNKFDLQLIEQYMRDFASYGNFSANLDADIKSSGNFKDQLNMKLTGMVGVNDFHFGKTPSDDFASFNKLVLDLKLISPKDSVYLIDSIMLNKIFFKYERYDYLDNLQRMFGKGGANYKAVKADSSKFNLIVEVAKFVEVIGKNFLQSYFRIGKVAVYDGDVKFSDYSLREKFSIAAKPLYLLADSIDRNNKRFKASLQTGIQPYGNLVGNLSFNPNDVGDFDLKVNLRKIPVTLFNPYLITYTSFPLDRGTLEFTAAWAVRGGQIQSTNHLLIIDPRVAKRVRKEDTKWIPVPFIMSLVRSSGNVIDFQIPIEGDLKSPKFKLWPAIGGVVRNIFVKPPSSFYLVHVKKIEQDVEKSLTLSFQRRQTELIPKQEKFVNRMADFLEKNPEASITVSPIIYSEKEKEHILLFEAKKKFFKSVTNGSMTEDDSSMIDKMSVKDSAFIKYLNKQTHNSMMFTLQEKCMAIISASHVNSKFEQLIKQRQQIFLSYFKEGKSEDRVKFHRSESQVPFNGFSYYKIKYNGEIPDRLQKAYEEMNELNNEAPREKYKTERKKSNRINSYR